MVTLTIDGQKVEVPRGTKVIEAAKRIGIEIPFYCYHPGLSIAGNCRMCLVEIEKMPKLQLACHLEAAEGMVVRTSTPKVLETRRHVLEFLLANHPVDCPVCDQSGECWLQDYYLEYGLYESRFREQKIKKAKAVAIGPHVMLDSERCILCSRCIRFCDEVSKTSELGFIQRGDRTEIAVAAGKSLDNPYSGNTVDICPVGALTDRDFRFKIRVWYLESGNSICNGCARGCPVQVQYRKSRFHHSRRERVMRLKPRYDASVNRWWICDEGRYGYKYHDRERIPAPAKRVSGNVSSKAWEDVLAEIAREFQSSAGKAGALLSPQLSNEELFMAKRLFCDFLGWKDVLLLPANPEGYQDEILIRADKHANTEGARALGFSRSEKALDELFSRCEKGQVCGLVIFGQNLFSLLGEDRARGVLECVGWTVFLGSNRNEMSEHAMYQLPCATHFEGEGTFTNFEGKVQKFDRILEPLGEALPATEILQRLAIASGAGWEIQSPGRIFRELADGVSGFQGLSYEALDQGAVDFKAVASPVIPAIQQGKHRA